MNDNKKILKKGDSVTWTSSGRGTVAEKTGTVVAYLAGGDDISRHIPRSTPAHNIMTRRPASLHKRYLVRVQEGERTVFYTPRAATVNEQVAPAATKAPAKKAGKKDPAKKAATKTAKKAAKKAAKKPAKKATRRAGKKDKEPPMWQKMGWTKPGRKAL